MVQTPQEQEHQLKMAQQLDQLNGSQKALEQAIQSMAQLVRDSFAPKTTLDEITISPTYTTVESYNYPYLALWVDDSDAGVTVTYGNRIQSHTFTLVGGWNTLHPPLTNAWWKSSSTINGMLLRSRQPLSLSGGTTTLGSVLITNEYGSPVTTLGSNYDALSPFTGLAVVNAPVLYNGNTHDVMQNNTQGTVISSGTFTTDQTSSTMMNYNARGVICNLNVSAISGTSPTITAYLMSSDPASGTSYSLAATSAITATGLTQFGVYPGASTNGMVSLPLPREWFVKLTLGGTSPSVTCSVGYQSIL